MVMNQTWIERAKITHLYQYKSDHRPIKLELHVGMPPNKRRRAFCFQAAWLTQPELRMVVDGNWKKDEE